MLLHKHYPWYPKSKHSAWECSNLRKSLNAPLLKKDKKGNEDEEDDKMDG